MQSEHFPLRPGSLTSAQFRDLVGYLNTLAEKSVGLASPEADLNLFLDLVTRSPLPFGIKVSIRRRYQELARRPGFKMEDLILPRDFLVQMIRENQSDDLWVPERLTDFSIYVRDLVRNRLADSSAKAPSERMKSDLETVLKSNPLMDWRIRHHLGLKVKGGLAGQIDPTREREEFNVFWVKCERELEEIRASRAPKALPPMTAKKPTAPKALAGIPLETSPRIPTPVQPAPKAGSVAEAPVVRAPKVAAVAVPAVRPEKAKAESKPIVTMVSKWFKGAMERVLPEPDHAISAEKAILRGREAKLRILVEKYGVAPTSDMLCDAIVAEHEGILRYLLDEKKVDPNQSGEKFGVAPLSLAAIHGKGLATEILLKRGARVDGVDADWNMPLHLAIMSGNLGVARVLLMNGADRNRKNRLRQSPMDLAQVMGEDFKALLEMDGLELVQSKMEKDKLGQGVGAPEAKAAIAVEMPGEKRSLVDRMGSNAKSVARWMRRSNPFNELNRIDNSKGGDHMTKLIRAVIRSRGKYGEIRDLLDQGANVNQVDGAGRSPFYAAVFRGDIKLADLLLGAGAKIDQYSEVTGHLNPLLVAVENKDQTMVGWLLGRGASVDAKDVNGYTALRRAAFDGSVGIMEILLENGAKVDSVGKADGLTPLFAAVVENRVDAVRLLLKWGADPMFENKKVKGETVLSFATKEEGKEMKEIRELLEKALEEKWEVKEEPVIEKPKAVEGVGIVIPKAEGRKRREALGQMGKGLPDIKMPERQKVPPSTNQVAVVEKNGLQVHVFDRGQAIPSPKAESQKPVAPVATPSPSVAAQPSPRRESKLEDTAEVCVIDPTFEFERRVDGFGEFDIVSTTVRGNRIFNLKKRADGARLEGGFVEYKETESLLKVRFVDRSVNFYKKNGQMLNPENALDAGDFVQGRAWVRFPEGYNYWTREGGLLIFSDQLERNAGSKNAHTAFKRKPEWFVEAHDFRKMGDGHYYGKVARMAGEATEVAWFDFEGRPYQGEAKKAEKAQAPAVAKIQAPLKTPNPWKRPEDPKGVVPEILSAEQAFAKATLAVDPSLQAQGQGEAEKEIDPMSEQGKRLIQRLEDFTDSTGGLMVPAPFCNAVKNYLSLVQPDVEGGRMASLFIPVLRELWLGRQIDLDLLSVAHAADERTNPKKYEVLYQAGVTQCGNGDRKSLLIALDLYQECLRTCPESEQGLRLEVIGNIKRINEALSKKPEDPLEKEQSIHDWLKE